jgi:hypothetical protein
VTSNPTPDPSGPPDATPDPAAHSFGLDFEFARRSVLDRCLTWYREELRLRQLVAGLALPALLGLTGLGMLTTQGPVPWLLAGLTFATAAEVATTSLQLRRRRGASQLPR